MAGPNDRPELERRARGVFGRQADVGLDHRHLALLDHQHRNFFDPHEKRIQQIRPVEQRVVLESHLAAGLQKGVEILVVVVLHRLRADQGLHAHRIARVFAFQFLDVVEFAQPAGDGAAGQRLAFERRDDAARVEHSAAAGRLRRNHGHLELLFRQAERLEGKMPMSLQSLELVGHGQTVHAFARDDEESDGMDGHEASGRQHGPLHALLPARLKPRSQIGQQTQIADRLGRLRADRQRAAHLGDDHADLARPHLNPRMLLDKVDEPQFDMPTGHSRSA